MNKAAMAMLERVFKREVEAAISHWPSHLFQTDSKLAAKMAEDGYLRHRTLELPGDRFGRIAVSGYELTDLGRMHYCMTCSDEPEDATQSSPAKST